MAKKENVHLQLSQELSGIDADLEKAIEALTETNHRIDSFLNEEDGEQTELSENNSIKSEPDSEPEKIVDSEGNSAETSQTTK